MTAVAAVVLGAGLAACSGSPSPDTSATTVAPAISSTTTESTTTTTTEASTTTTESTTTTAAPVPPTTATPTTTAAPCSDPSCPLYHDKPIDTPTVDGVTGERYGGHFEGSGNPDSLHGKGDAQGTLGP